MIAVIAKNKTEYTEYRRANKLKDGKDCIYVYNSDAGRGFDIHEKVELPMARYNPKYLETVMAVDARIRQYILYKKNT